MGIIQFPHDPVIQSQRRQIESQAEIIEQQRKQIEEMIQQTDFKAKQQDLTELNGDGNRNRGRYGEDER